MPITLKEKFKTVVKLIGEPKVLYSLISFRSFGYLLQTGWFNSFKTGQSVDEDLTPIPWFTYSAIDFLKDRLNNNLNILEFGSGNSTLFFADRVKNIISLEHNHAWLQKIMDRKPSNVELIFTSSVTVKDYLRPIDEKSKFDLIIVDGLFRNECINISLKLLTESGVIILDDSERSEYNEGITFLSKNNFRQLIFSGIAPGIFFKKCTTIFYKDKNCLGI